MAVTDLEGIPANPADRTNDLGPWHCYCRFAFLPPHHNAMRHGAQSQRDRKTFQSRTADYRELAYCMRVCRRLQIICSSPNSCTDIPAYLRDDYCINTWFFVMGAVCSPIPWYIWHTPGTLMTKVTREFGSSAFIETLRHGSSGLCSRSSTTCLCFLGLSGIHHYVNEI